MSSDMFSSHGSDKKFEPWYEKEKRTWLEFRKGCRGRYYDREPGVCYLMDAKIVCNADSKDKCPLWYLKNFRPRARRKDDR